jgi:ribosomal protein L35
MKLKTRKSASKRIKNKKNVLYRKKAFKSHLLINKTSKRLRHLAQSTKINKVDLKNYFKMLN